MIVSNTFSEDYFLPLLPLSSPPFDIPYTSDIMSGLSPIPEYDGYQSHDDDSPQHDQHQVTLPTNDHTMPGPSTAAGTHRHDASTRLQVNTRKASFSLDRNKQLKKHRKGTNLTDFEIEISPSNENVKIYCSTGFYTKVVIPAFDQLAAGSTTNVDNVTVKCQDVTQRTDATGAATSTVLMFRMFQHQLSLGQVTIHLHHTSRNCQVQGSALFPDNMKAPVWFVENFHQRQI